MRSPRSEPHCCDVSAARRMAASYALSTIAASLAMSGWLRADVICDAFPTISPQTETNTKRNKNVFVRATINVKWSPNKPQGRQLVGPRSWSHACFCHALFLTSPPEHSSVHPLWLCISQEPLCRNGACRQRMSVWVTLTPAFRVARLGNAFVLLPDGMGSLKF